MASFHFSSSADEQLVADIAAADTFEDEVFAAFIEMILTFLTTAQQASQMMSRIEAFATERGVAVETLRTVVRAWMTFFRAVQRSNLSPKALFEDLMKLGFSKGKSTYIGKQYKANLGDLSRTLVGRTLMVNQLVDMEWKFGVTAGSSEFRQSGDTFLQLKLTLNRGTSTEDVFMGAAATRNVALTPPMGWSSWTSYACGVTADDLTGAATALIEHGLADVGFRIVHVDDCWMTSNRTDNGNGHQMSDPQRFPQGVEAVSAFLQAHNMSFGIYTARGTHTCQRKAASCLYERVDAAYYRSINVSFVKDDSCSGCISAVSAEDDIENDYARMQQSIDDVGGGMSLFFEGQPNISVVYTGAFGNGRRVGHDINANWPSMITLVDIGSGLWPYAHTDQGSGSFFNWLDFLQVGSGDFTPTSVGLNASDLGGVRSRAHVSIFSAMKSLLFLGNRLETFTPPVLSVLSNPEVMAVNQDSLGVQARRIASYPPRNTSIVLTEDFGGAVLAPCDGSALQNWRYAPNPMVPWVNIATCNPNDPLQRWTGLKTSAPGSVLRNVGTGTCVDVHRTTGADIGLSPCQPNASTQNFYLDPSSHHIQCVENHACLSIYAFAGPNIAMDGCKRPGDDDGNEQFFFDSSTGLIHTANDSRIPPNSCLTLRNLSHSGQLWLPASAGDFEGLEGQPAACLSMRGQAEGQTILLPCNPSNDSLPDPDNSFVLQPSSGNTSNSYTLMQDGQRWLLGWNNQFGASGPLPHTRWLTSAGSALFSYNFSQADGSPLKALSSSIYNDNNIGNVSVGGDFCLAASRLGNLEVWAGPVSKGMVVVLLNRSPNTDNITVDFSLLPPAAPPTEADRARAEGRKPYANTPLPTAGYTADSSFNIRDLWAQRDLGKFTGSYSASVLSQGAQMLLLTSA